MNADKELAISYKGKTIRLSFAKNPNQFLSPRTLALRYGKGGVPFVRDVLGIKVKLPPIQPKEINKISENIAATEPTEEIPLQTIEQVEESLNNVLETSTQTDLAFGPPGSLPFRELAGLDRSLRSMRSTVKKLISDQEVKKARVKELKDETSKVAYDHDHDDDGEVQFSENLREKKN